MLEEGMSYGNMTPLKSDNIGQETEIEEIFEA